MIKCPRKLGGHDRPQSREDSHADHKALKVGFAGRLPKNLKRGQFFRLKSGTITFFTHEHNLKFKVDN